MNTAHHVDINTGLDFERARERLNNAAAAAFRTYTITKKRPTASLEEVTDALDAYQALQRKAKGLRRTDAAAIAAALSEAH
ncbi:MAG: hypothetical protein A2X76_01435 [Lysobacterales bacterium GWF1_69_6]|nr:MAG: hypothetical protein A2X76_01435 [Xanthomonadales bacterium GWF1_69_6]